MKKSSICSSGAPVVCTEPEIRAGSETLLRDPRAAGPHLQDRQGLVVRAPEPPTSLALRRRAEFALRRDSADCRRRRGSSAERPEAESLGVDTKFVLPPVPARLRCKRPARAHFSRQLAPGF